MFWEYDTRLGRRWNIDPVVREWESAYSCFINNPIYSMDPDGDDPPKKLSSGEKLKNWFSGKGYINRAIKYSRKNNIDEADLTIDQDHGAAVVYKSNSTTNEDGEVVIMPGSKSVFRANHSPFKRGLGVGEKYNDDIEVEYNNERGEDGKIILNESDYAWLPNVSPTDALGGTGRAVKGVGIIYKGVRWSEKYGRVLPYVGKTINTLKKRYTQAEMAAGKYKGVILQKINSNKLLRAVEQRVYEFMKAKGPVANKNNPFNPNKSDYKEYMKKADAWLEKNYPNWKDEF